MKQLFLFFFCLSFLGLRSQTVSFSNTIGGSIPDNGPAVTFAIVVSDPRLDSLSGTFGFQSIRLSISHTYDSDLEAQLEAPDGTIVPLFQNVGGSGDSFTNTEFSDTASTSINLGSAPFTGYFQPIGGLWQFNNLHSGNGTWYLIVRDDAALDTGSVRYATLNFSSSPALPPPPITSNLAIVKIYTDSGAQIIDYPRIGARMEIVDHGSGIRNGQNDTVLAFVGRIGIEIRGSSSQMFPKKSYGYQTWDSTGVKIDTTILGFPPGSDWIFNAHYTDKTLFRNNLSYDLARDMGEYASRVRFVEMFVNDEYEGVYVAMEEIKRDSDRVNISKLKSTDTSGSQLTGGYILKIDKFTGSGGAGWYSQIPCTNSGGTIFPYIQYDYPSDGSIQPQQAAYIHSYMDTFEAALNGPDYRDSVLGFRKYAAENTFIDYEIINEIAKNVDGYRLSTYFYKEKSTHGGLLKMGPVWDYDIAYDNADYCGGYIDTGWAYDYNYVCSPAAVPFWWERLMTDSTYTRRLFCRYTNLRTEGPLRFDSLFNYIDSNASLVNEAQQRNFIRWPILGTYVWPNPQPVPTTYAGEIQNLKNWLTERLSWLDTAMMAFSTAYPAVHLPGDTAICQGQQIVLDAGPYCTYLWNTGSTDRIIDVTQTGSYAVTASSYYGCASSGQINLFVQPLPDGRFTKTVIDSNNYLFAPVTAMQGSYYWQFGDSSSATAATGSHHYDSAGTYTIRLTVTDSLGCRTSWSDTIHVQVPSQQPTSVTSTSDGTVRIYPNPASSSVYIETVSASTAQIYNPLGEKLISRPLATGINAIDISNLASGVYVVMVSNGMGSYTVKWVKE